MPTLQELNAKVDELQTALDTEQQEVADLIASKDAAIATLTQTVSDLQAIIDAGNPANEAEIQAILDKVNTAITDLQGTV